MSKAGARYTTTLKIIKVRKIDTAKLFFDFNFMIKINWRHHFPVDLCHNKDCSERNDKSYSVDKNVGSAPRPSDRVKNTGKSDVNTDNSLLDVYTIVTAIDIANLLSDNRMASELFYSQEECSSNPSHRVLQSYLRAFQLPSHLLNIEEHRLLISYLLYTRSIFLPYRL